MKSATAKALTVGALALCLVAIGGSAGAQDGTGEPPTGATAQGQQPPAPGPLPPGILLAPQTNAPPRAEPPGGLQSCPDQGQRLELIV